MMSGSDLAKRPRDNWIIDFGARSESEAALYGPVFEHLKTAMRGVRSGNRESRLERRWWQYRRSGAKVRELLDSEARVIATVLVSRRRFFVWLSARVLPDTRIVLIGRKDDTSIGVLSSRIHEAWTLRYCQFHGVGNDPVYTPSTTFETFPFPYGLTPNLPASTYESDPRAVRIAAAARRLDELRRNWLNPQDLIRIEPEVVPGFPDRVLPINDEAAAVLRKRTLTKLYNEGPTWLDHAHRELDAAVAAAYGWPEDISTDDALVRLLALNQERAGLTGDSE